MRVVPVIGILTDMHSFKPVPNAAEVEAVFDAPLEMFLKVCYDGTSNISPLILRVFFQFTP